MKLTNFSWIRVSASAPECRVGDVVFNTEKIIKLLYKASENGCKIALFPELCITGYTCADMFFQSTLLEASTKALLQIAECTADIDSIAIVGAPAVSNGKMYNCAFFISNGRILGVVPKTYICNYGEYYEERWFSSDRDRTENEIIIDGQKIPFGADLLFRHKSLPLCIGLEICEDLWSVKPPSSDCALAGANLLMNLSASNEYLGKSAYRKQLIMQQSASCFAAYVYSSAGPGESTTDTVFSGHCMIAEYGKLLAESPRFEFDSTIIYADIDIEKLNSERIKTTSFGYGRPDKSFRVVEFDFEEKDVLCTFRKYSKTPFVPEDLDMRRDNVQEIVAIQSTAILTRLRHIKCKNVVIGISGGLDSTLALLSVYHGFKRAGMDTKGIHAISMPGFGTTSRTKNNSLKLAEHLGVTMREISINESVQAHFKDIGHNEEVKDIVYENAQARRRTHILMDIANQVSGIVIGTGDLSELAMGWCTYNGDHMSMYGINSGIPKTLVKYIINWYAEEVFKGDISKVLHDISATPISPELLPPNEDGTISQETEDSIGPYILHDFFLYHFLRFGYQPNKIAEIASLAFVDEFSFDEIQRWLSEFYKRFFTSQFKRSAIPDGVKIGTVSLSPRSDWRMPSDMSLALWKDKD